MSCTDIITFYRICGHTVKGSRHSQPCLEARVGENTCWNPLPNKVERHYLVQHCLDCLEVYLDGLPDLEAESFQDAMTNPARRLHDLGENPQVLNPGSRLPCEIKSNSEISRLLQIHHESGSRIQSIAMVLKNSEENYAREREWIHDFRTYVSQPGDVPGTEKEQPLIICPQIKDNTPNVLLAEAHGPFEGEVCSVCQEDLEPELPEEDEDDEDPDPPEPNTARSLPCGHIFHHACIESWLISNDNPACPHCRREYDVVCNNGFEKPVYRFYPETVQYLQISGYVPFPKCGRGGMGNYKMDQEPDRWGDKIGY